MKPEEAERLFIEDLFNKSIELNKIPHTTISYIDKMTGDASTRRYYRVYCDENSSNYVVCLDNPVKKLEENPFLRMQSFLQGNGVRVPRVYDSIASKGYILEEDLTDQTYLKYLSEIVDPKVIEDKYKELLNIMLTIHRINIVDTPWINLYFDYQKLFDEVSFTSNYFLNKYLNCKDQALVSGIEQEFKDICKRLSQEKMVLTHRDFHSRNIMCVKDELVVIDFQDARYGIAHYDLASLLDDCYYCIASEMKERLIKYYYDQARNFLELDFDQFRSLYDDMAIQRLYKAIGSFSYIYDLREDKRYLRYIGFAMEKIKLILLNKKRYHPLYKKLFGLYYAS